MPDDEEEEENAPAPLPLPKDGLPGLEAVLGTEGLGRCRRRRGGRGRGRRPENGTSKTAPMAPMNPAHRQAVHPIRLSPDAARIRVPGFGGSSWKWTYMSGQTLTSKQMIAFKIGARARKFAVEGCPIEGYDYLYGCLAEAQATDPELHRLLLTESEKFEKRLQAMEAAGDW